MKACGYVILNISTVLQDFIMDVGRFSKGSLASLQKAWGYIVETYYYWVLVTWAETLQATKHALQYKFQKQCHHSNSSKSAYALYTRYLEYLASHHSLSPEAPLQTDHPEEANKELSVWEELQETWDGEYDQMPLYTHSQRINNFLKGGRSWVLTSRAPPCHCFYPQPHPSNCSCENSISSSRGELSATLCLVLTSLSLELLFSRC